MVAPRTSPQPVGSLNEALTRGGAAATSAVDTAPDSDESAPRRNRSDSRVNPGAFTYTSPREPNVTTSDATPHCIAVAASDIGSAAIIDISSSLTCTRSQQRNQPSVFGSGCSVRSPLDWTASSREWRSQ